MSAVKKTMLSTLVAFLPAVIAWGACMSFSSSPCSDMHDMDTDCIEDCRVVECDPDERCVNVYTGGWTECVQATAECWCEEYKLEQKLDEEDRCYCGDEKAPNTVTFYHEKGTRSTVTIYGDLC